MICGHGMPNFYAIEIAKGKKCEPSWKNLVFSGILDEFKVCKTIDDYYLDEDLDGNPLVEECIKNSFVSYYTTAESMELFDALYSNKYGLTDKFLAFWEVIAERFSKNTNIIGFNPINEPFVGNFMKNIMLLYPKHFDREHLTPLYASVYKILQKHDPQSILQFETS